MVNIQTIAVIGAGVMGSGLAEDLAVHGYNVLLKDLTTEILQMAQSNILQFIRMQRMTMPELRSVSDEEILNRINLTTDYQGFEMVDFVIENITENYESKAKLYMELVKVCRPKVIYGVNTSCISITKIASLVPDPTKVIGMHLMNPVPLKNLVEVVLGHHTSEQTVDTAVALVKSLKKEAVVVNDFPGFVTNRVLMLMINEAIFLIQDGVATPAKVDKIFRLGFAHKMGPLATGDLIGLDTILQSLEVLYESYNDPKYRPAPLLKKMVAAGLLGRKTGQGFFKY